MNIPQPISITLYSEKLKAFSLRSGKRQGWPLSTLLLNILLEVLDKEVRQEKKRHPSWKGRNKIICLQITWSYIWKFLKTPHTHTHTLSLSHKLLEIINSVKLGDTKSYVSYLCQKNPIYIYIYNNNNTHLLSCFKLPKWHVLLDSSLTMPHSIH